MNKSDFSLLQHEFVISVLKNMASVLEPIETEFLENLEQEKNKSTQSKYEFVPVLTKGQAYHNDVFQNVNNLLRAIERLEEIPYYLSRFPNTKTFQKEGITLHKWLQYHYSAFLITMVSLYDTTLLLTNAVFRLGLRPQDCNDRTITKNLNIRGTAVQDVLKRLNKKTQSYREPRNLYVHRNRMPPLDLLDRLEGFRFIQEESESLEIEGNPILHPVIRRELYKQERKNLIQKVREEAGEIKDVLKDVFDVLHPIYSIYTKHFENEGAS